MSTSVWTCATSQIRMFVARRFIHLCGTPFSFSRDALPRVTFGASPSRVTELLTSVAARHAGDWKLRAGCMPHVVTAMDGRSPSRAPTRARSSRFMPARSDPPSPTATATPSGCVIRARGGPRVTSKPPLEEPTGDAAGNPRKRQRSSRPERRMCRRGSDSGDIADRKIVALAAFKATKPARAAAVATARSFATRAQKKVEAHNQKTIRARVQHLLVQFVMLPVVWMSLCCVITAAMGIEAVESIQKALLQNGSCDDELTLERPAKKVKREVRLRVSEAVDESELVIKGKESSAIMSSKETAEVDPTSVEATNHVQATQPTTAPRRRRVLIWDLDETLVLFASLYSGQFARTHNKEHAMSVALGEQMMKYLLAVLERHFFFSDLHDADIDHITSVQNTTDEDPTSLHGIPKDSPLYARVVAHRYARIRAIYERRAAAVDFLDDPTSQWFTARQALVTSIDTLSTGWIREAKEILTLTAQRAAGGQDDVEIINVMVTNTQLSPALCKCLIYGLDAHFPIESIYSSSKLHKMRCFQTIMNKYGSRSGACVGNEVEFVAIGDGAEEEQVSRALGISFFKIRSLDDLRQLRYELQLVERSCGSEQQKATPAFAVTPVTMASKQ